MTWKLCKRTIWGKYKPLTQEEAEKIGPHLLMIDDDQSASLRTGIGVGRIKHKGRFEGDKERLNILRGDKLLRAELWGVKIPLWVHSKNEVYSYPHSPKADAEALGKTFVGLQQNWKNLEEAASKAQWKQMLIYLKVAGYVAAGVAAIYAAPFLLDWLLGIYIPVPWMPEQAATVASNTTTAIKNITQAIPLIG